MKRISTILILLFFCIAFASAQRASRGRLQLREPIKIEKPMYDTIAVEGGEIQVSGYEKGQSSAYESMFITNTTDYKISSVNITIRYENEKGEQLHQRTETIKTDLPSGETRQVSIKSWDRQHLWYYVNSQAPHNESGSPFLVKIRVNYVIVKSGH